MSAAPGHLILDNYDLGFEVVPDLGISAGMWNVRAAVWGVDLAAEAGAVGRATPKYDALAPDTVDTPMSPEIQVSQMEPD